MPEGQPGASTPPPLGIPYPQARQTALDPSMVWGTLCPQPLTSNQSLPGNTRLSRAQPKGPSGQQQQSGTRFAQLGLSLGWCNVVGLRHNSPLHPAPSCSQHLGQAKQGSESNQLPPISQIPGDFLRPVQKPSLHGLQQDSSWAHYFLTITWPGRLVHPEKDGRMQRLEGPRAAQQRQELALQFQSSPARGASSLA